jgi:hypothetical protein
MYNSKFYIFVQDLAEWIAEGLRAYGLDYVKVQNYSMLLDYPDSANPNLIRNKVLFEFYIYFFLNKATKCFNYFFIF